MSRQKREQIGRKGATLGVLKATNQRRVVLGTTDESTSTNHLLPKEVEDRTDHIFTSKAVHSKADDTASERGQDTFNSIEPQDRRIIS